VDDLSPGIRLRQEHYSLMAGHVAAAFPEEACGIVGGLEGRSVRVFPVENILHSRTRFKMEPESQLRVLLELEQNGQDLLAIYHSHPDGPPHPSETDIAEAYYPEAAAVIWFRHGEEWRCRAFKIQDNQVVELILHLIRDECN
jgi:[CysO sulfur-carrier protein]-S-L-cysteine hydrolase